MNAMKTEASKHDGKGKTLASLENYDVEQAINVVLELGEGLIEATKHAKGHFRREWLDQLVARYRERPGKPIVHLSDLPDQVIPTLSPDVRELLRPHWEKLVGDRGSEWGSLHFRCMWDIMKSGKASRWSSLRLWRRFSELTAFRIDDLEPYVVAIRAANTGTSRVILEPKLPVKLATRDGAKLFGYRGDASHDTSAMHNLDKTVHDDYKQAVLATVGKVPFTTTRSAKDEVIRTNVGVFVTILTSIAGLDNSIRQKLARNPIPSWFFQVDESTRISCLRTLFEAEGSPTRNALKLSQSVGWKMVPAIGIPKWPAKQPVNALRAETRDQFLRRPPLLLVSAALLLSQSGIQSYVLPSMVASTKSGCSVYWFLQVYRTINMRRFEQLIGFVSKKKQAKLAKYNGMHEPKSSPPLFFLSRSEPLPQWRAP